MKKLAIILFGLIFGLSIKAQYGDNIYEKIYTWATPNKDSCFRLSNIPEYYSVGLQVVTTNLTDGYFKLFGKSENSPAWLVYGSAVGANDSILLSGIIAVGNYRSSGWVYEKPIFDNWKVCFYKQNDTAGIIQFYQVMGSRK